MTTLRAIRSRRSTARRLDWCRTSTWWTTTTATGSDDEGATAVVALQIVGGSGSGFRAGDDEGLQIDLFREADGDVTGRVGGAAGTVIFAISIDGNGSVTVAQYDSLEHPTSRTVTTRRSTLPVCSTRL